MKGKKKMKIIAKKFGGKEKVRIFAARLRKNGEKKPFEARSLKIIDNIERDNEVKKTKRESLFEEETISQATKAKSLSDETREWKLQGRTGDA